MTSFKQWKSSLHPSDSFPTNKRNVIKKTQTFIHFFFFQINCNQFALCTLSRSFCCRQSKKSSICWKSSKLNGNLKKNVEVNTLFDTTSSYFKMMRWRRLNSVTILCTHIQVNKRRSILNQLNTFFKRFHLWVAYQKEAFGHFEGISANIITHNLITLILKKIFMSTFDHFL